MARRDRADKASHADSPATRLLDALRTGDDLGVLAVCGDTTVVSADTMDWACRGRDEIQEMLNEVRGRFPGITFESRTRHVRFGLVVDEARVQDVPPDDAEVGDEDEGVVAEKDDRTGPDAHPMWDQPLTDDHPATRLNMPVRVTVRHDDLQVHEITLSFPAALLKRALGMHVDPLEMSVSEVQSAFIAPVGAGFSTYTLGRPELAVVPPPSDPEEVPTGDEPPRRRRRMLVPMLVALVAVVGAGGWWAVQGNDSTVVAGTPPASSTPDPSTQPSASTPPSTQPSSSKAPTITHARPSNTPSRRPNITLKSDLAFSINSSTLSKKAKAAIDKVAARVRRNHLTGKIFVDGYTDNLGSAASGQLLSQRRADTVSAYLGSQLVGVPVTIVSIAHGEADPVADNSTEAGREANRRVTITLPKP